MTLNSYYQNVKTDGWKKEAIEHLLWGCVNELAIGNYIVRLKSTNGKND